MRDFLIEERMAKKRNWTAEDLCPGDVMEWAGSEITLVTEEGPSFWRAEMYNLEGGKVSIRVKICELGRRVSKEVML